MSDRSPRFPSPVFAPHEREAVIAHLSECFAQDRLSLEEFECRVTAAYRASTAADLAVLTTDLAAATPGARTAGCDVGTRSMVGQVSAIWGNVERRDTGDVPPYLELRAIAGNVELDLSAARFAPGVTEIAIRALMGNIEVRLPPSVGVENQARSVVGSLTCRGGEWRAASQEAATVVRVTGRAVLSAIAITASGPSAPGS